jgi:FkbM family methyltransferase
MGPSLTTFKLLLMAAAFSRPSLRNLCLLLLRPFVHHGEIKVRYRYENRFYTVFIRTDDMNSDYYSVLELGVHRIYTLNRAFVPDLVVDCGGNIGLFSLTASALYPTAKIVICEPVPTNLDRIKKHLTINRVQADIMAVCIGGMRRKIPFFIREANQGSFDPSKPFSSKMDVDVLTLAEVLSGRDARTILIKLDIEGMEIETLQSYVPTENRPICVVGELHGHKENSLLLETIFRTKGWTLHFANVSDQSSAFEAYSPSAQALLHQTQVPAASIQTGEERGR